jgi:hypothetical protein
MGKPVLADVVLLTSARQSGAAHDAGSSFSDSRKCSRPATAATFYTDPFLRPPELAASAETVFCLAGLIAG